MTQPAAPRTPLFEHLVSALDVGVLERRPDGRFDVLGEAPGWFYALWPGFTVNTGLDVGEASPFLKHFLGDAEAAWSGRDTAPVHSGPWEATAPSGDAHMLEAIALRTGARDLLLITFYTTDFDTLQTLLQKSRDQNLNYQKLIKEIDKREVLLHCIVHDLSNPLAAIRGSLFLMQQDGIVRNEGGELLGVAMHQVEKMQLLIREILSSFAQEIKPLLPTVEVDHEAAVDLAKSAQEALAAFEAAAALGRVELRLEKGGGPWRVRGEAVRLERVFYNLLENALRHTPEGGTVTIRLTGEDQSVRVAIEDSGSGVPDDQVRHLFQKFTQGTENTGKAGLGLYSCRLIVEHWGGTIGYEPSPSGGSSFWFCLPRLAQ